MDFGLLLLRATVGLTLAAHGSQKLFGWFGGYGLDGTGRFMEAIGFRPGRRHALAAGVVEVAGGLLLALGLLTPLAVGLVVSLMLVATATVHWKHGFFAMQNGYEFNLVLAVGALSIAFTGPGTWSLDTLLGWSSGGAVWGSLAIVLALAGAGAQLASRGQASAGGARSAA